MLGDDGKPSLNSHQALGAHELAKDAQQGGPFSSAEPRPEPGTIDGAEGGKSDAVHATA